MDTLCTIKVPAVAAKNQEFIIIKITILFILKKTTQYWQMHINFFEWLLKYT